VDQDVARYAEVTGDYNPVQDSEFVTSVAGFDRGRVVHGMLIASLFPSIISSNFVCRSHLALFCSFRHFAKHPPGI
jgi:acyl dehydratase